MTDKAADELSSPSAMPFRIPASGGSIVPDGLFGLWIAHNDLWHTIACRHA